MTRRLALAFALTLLPSCTTVGDGLIGLGVLLQCGPIPMSPSQCRREQAPVAPPHGEGILRGQK